MKKKIVIKVGADCEKCRGKAMKIAAVADGVVSIAIGGDDKDKLIVIGEGIDAACLAKALKKKLCYANLETIEEVKPPPPVVKPPAPPPKPVPCTCPPLKPVPCTCPPPKRVPCTCPPLKPVPCTCPHPKPVPCPPPKAPTPAPVPCPPTWCPPQCYPPPYYQPPCQPEIELYKVVTDPYGTTPSCIIQ